MSSVQTSTTKIPSEWQKERKNLQILAIRVLQVINALDALCQVGPTELVSIGGTTPCETSSST